MTQNKTSFLLLALAFLIPSAHAANIQSIPDLPTVNNTTLSLKDALVIAWSDNITLKESQIDVKSANAATRSAQAQTKPVLSTTTYGSYGDSSNILTTSPGVTPQNIFSVTPNGFADQDLMLTVPIFTGGKLEKNSTAAHQQEDAAGLMVSASRLAVTESVTEAYTNAALQQALVDSAQARLTAENEQVRITQEKVTAGRSAPVDLLREQAEQADASQSLLAAQNNVGLALINLKTDLGVSQESQITLSDTLDTLAGAGDLPGTLSDALHQADQNRPEMAAAERQIEAARSSVGAAHGEYAPQIYGVAMGDATAGQGINRAGYTVGLTASLPILDGGQRRADVDSATDRLDKARANAQQTRQQIDQEAASSWLNVQTAQAQMLSASAGVTASQEGYDLANLRYNAGKSVTAERLDALSALVRAQGELAQAKASLIIAQARLKAAIGQNVS